MLDINKPFDAPGDTRYLGVMVSYIAVTDDIERVEEIERVSSHVINAVKGRDPSASLSSWAGKIEADFLSSAEDFYTGSVQPAPTSREMNHPVKKFSVQYKRERWVADKVGDKGVLLDVGCGLGGLSHLAGKGVKVIGLDLSVDNCRSALSRGYDACLKASATELPLKDNSLDHLVSLDVVGHIPGAQKKKMFEEFARVLRAGGNCIHLIETDRFRPEEMDPEGYARMVLVDGHVGIEERAESERLFSERFEIKESFLVGNVCMSLDHWVRAHDLYGANMPGEVLSFLLNARESEKEYFNLGVGWTFWNLLAEKYDSTSTGGLLFLHARKPGDMAEAEASPGSEGDIYDMLRCTSCGGGLRKEEDSLSCSGCEKKYPIDGDVPIFV